MELLEISSEQISDEKIRERWTHAGNGMYTHRFIAMEDGKEVGFLAVDIIPEYEHFIIYEIYVVKSSRRHGIGVKLLDAAEQMALDNGYAWSLVTARSLTDDFSQVDLEAWYRRRSYEILPNAQAVGTFVKKLSPR